MQISGYKRCFSPLALEAGSHPPCLPFTCVSHAPLWMRSCAVLPLDGAAPQRKPSVTTGLDSSSVLPESPHADRAGRVPARVGQRFLHFFHARRENVLTLALKTTSLQMNERRPVQLWRTRGETGGGSATSMYLTCSPAAWWPSRKARFWVARQAPPHHSCQGNACMRRRRRGLGVGGCRTGGGGARQVQCHRFPDTV